MYKTIAAAAAILVTFAAPAAAGAHGVSRLDSVRSNGCDMALLHRPAHGSQALEVLGRDGIAAAATRNHTSAAQLTERVRTDSELWLDHCGKAFYVEQADTETAATALNTSTTSTAAYPYDQTFALHSHPGSARVIYLDFNGQQVSGTAWNSSYTGGAAFTASPFDVDGHPGTFSTAERAVVQSVWQRVAEDYAPFDVDVTTEDPGEAAIDRSGSADQQYGTRVVITNQAGPGGSDCNCGGIAYVGVFDMASSHSTYQPAFVFAAGVGTAKAIGEAAAHEAGHNFGLYHDGTATSSYYGGQGPWAPIMGVSYSHPISQWSRGEYSGANNSAQDDIAVIAAHGAPFRPDDYGNSAATATPLGTAQRVRGVIGSRSDTDWFSVQTAGGAIVASVRTSAVGADLDARVRVIGPDGTVVGTANPWAKQVSSDAVTGLNARYVSGVLPPGTYYVVVDGVGRGDPQTTGYSDYGSLGQYRLTVTADATPLTVATSALPGATRTGSYSARVTAKGGAGGYRWTRRSGALPPGVTLSARGALSGRPTELGYYSFTLAAHDAAGTVAARSFHVAVARRPVITTTALPRARRAHHYATSLGVERGRPSYHWQIVRGSLPRGMWFSSDGSLHGTPRRSGSWTVAIAVSDRWRARDVVSYRLRVR